VEIRDVTGSGYPEEDWHDIAEELRARGHVSSSEIDKFNHLSDAGGHDKRSGYRFNYSGFINHLKKKGITSLRYKNTAEDIGSESHIILDPENLEPVHDFRHLKFLKRDNVTHAPYSKQFFRLHHESLAARIIAESDWDKYLYHGTSAEFDPSQLKVGSHLGTLHAAMSREYDKQDFAKRYGETTGHPRIIAYKYTGSGKHIEMPDVTTGVSEHSDFALIAEHLMRHADPAEKQWEHTIDKGYGPYSSKGWIPPEDHKHFFDPASEEDEKAFRGELPYEQAGNRQFVHGLFHGHEHEVFNHHKFIDYMKSRGVTSIQYRNKKEGRDSVSHIIFDTENLKPMHVFKDPKYLKGRWIEKGYGSQEYFRRPPGEEAPKYTPRWYRGSQWQAEHPE